MPKLKDRTRLGSVFCCIALVRRPPPGTWRTPGQPLFFGPSYTKGRAESPNGMWFRLFRSTGLFGKTGALEIERGLHLAEVFELGLGAISRDVACGIRDVILGILDRPCEPPRIELDKVDGRLGKDREPRRPDLGKAAADEI